MDLTIREQRALASGVCTVVLILLGLYFVVTYWYIVLGGAVLILGLVALLRRISGAPSLWEEYEAWNTKMNIEREAEKAEKARIAAARTAAQERRNARVRELAAASKR